MGRLLRWGGMVLGLLLVLILLGYGFLRGGAPHLDGEVSLKGLSAEVTVSRDALGVPSISATDRLDALRALGYLHAQDRFFQMDLLRRRGAGELSDELWRISEDSLPATETASALGGGRAT